MIVHPTARKYILKKKKKRSLKTGKYYILCSEWSIFSYEGIHHRYILVDFILVVQSFFSRRWAREKKRVSSRKNILFIKSVCKLKYWIEYTDPQQFHWVCSQILTIMNQRWLKLYKIEGCDRKRGCNRVIGKIVAPSKPSCCEIMLCACLEYL